SGAPQSLTGAAEKKKPTLTQTPVDSPPPEHETRKPAAISHPSPTADNPSPAAVYQTVASDHRPPNTDAQPSAAKARSWGSVKLSNVVPDLNTILAEKPAGDAKADEPELLSGSERQAFDYETL